MTGKVKGCGIVDRQRERLVRAESVREARRIMPVEEIVGRVAGQAARARLAPRVARRKLLAASAGPSLRRDRESCGSPSSACIRASPTPSIAAVMWAIAFGDQPRVAAEQGGRDDPHRRPRRLGRHVARAPRSTSTPPSPRRLDRTTASAHRRRRARSWRRRSCAGRATARCPTSAGRGRSSDRAAS